MRELKANITRINKNFKRPKTGTKNWVYRWIKVPNVIDFSEEIWVRRWVKLSAPESKEQNYAVPVKVKEIKTFKCTFDRCKKSFSDASALKKHMAVHGERQFVCPVESCGKKFLDKSKLKRHQLVHTGERPYKCEICGKKFSLDFNLRTHIRTHTGTKPYKCSYPNCGKRFTQSSNLAAHEKTHAKKAGEGKKPRKARRPKKVKLDKDGNPIKRVYKKRKPRASKKTKKALELPASIDMKNFSPKIIQNAEKMLQAHFQGEKVKLVSSSGGKVPVKKKKRVSKKKQKKILPKPGKVDADLLKEAKLFSIQFEKNDQPKKSKAEKSDFEKSPNSKLKSKKISGKIFSNSKIGQNSDKTGQTPNQVHINQINNNQNFDSAQIQRSNLGQTRLAAVTQTKIKKNESLVFDRPEMDQRSQNNKEAEIKNMKSGVMRIQNYFQPEWKLKEREKVFEISQNPKNENREENKMESKKYIKKSDDNKI